MSNLESRTSGAEISGDLPTTITDQIDGIIFELPFDDKIKLWGLIDKLVLENKTEVSDEDIEKAMWEHFSDEWYREQLKKNKTMTALEFFYEQIIDSIGTNPKIDNLFEQAKEMEKQQIMEAVSFGDCRGRVTTYLTDEQYYNETYESKDMKQFHCKYCSRPMDVNLLEYRSNSYCNVCFDERASSKTIDKSINTFEFEGDVIPLLEPKETTSVEWLEKRIQDMIKHGADFGEDLPPLLVHIEQAKEMENKIISGLKERMWSEMEVLHIQDEYSKYIQKNFDPSFSILPFKVFFEQFKKK